MSTAVRTEPGTDVALSGSASVGKLTPEFQQALAMRRMRNQVAAQIGGTNWGKGLDVETTRGIADWGQQFRVDVTTEIHVLGGNIYLNVAFWLRQLGEMSAAGLVEYAFADHVEDDPRLKLIGPDGEGEYSRRLRERIKHNLPDKAASAVVFRVKLRSMDREVTGAKACGNGIKKNDPVGEQFPVETAESRAARRCMRLLASHVPPDMANHLGVIESSADVLSERVAHARNEIRESNARIEAPPPGRSRVPAGSMPLLNAADPYSEVDASRTTEMETAGRTAPVRVVEEQQASTTGGGVEEGGGGNRDSTSSLAPRRRYAIEETRCPMGARVGYPLWQISTADLAAAIDFIQKNRTQAQHPVFYPNAGDVLEMRRLGDIPEPTEEELATPKPPVAVAV